MPLLTTTTTAWLTAVLLFAPLTTALHIQTLSIIRTFPHDRAAFTEGLCFAPSSASNVCATAAPLLLLESTGLWRASTVRVVDLHTGRTLRELRLTDGEFGEGIAVADVDGEQRLLQLTYQNGTAYDYQLSTLLSLSEAASVPAVDERAAAYPYPPFVKEGWGLASWPGSDVLYMSDGRSALHILSTNNFTYLRSLSISTSHTSSQQPPTTKLDIASSLSLNELELLSPNLLLANLYPTRCLALINLTSAELLSVVQADERMHRSVWPAFDVMNGIAYQPGSGVMDEMLLVTGKRWPWMYQVEIVEHRQQQRRDSAEQFDKLSDEEQLRRACPTPAWTAAEAEHAKFVLAAVDEANSRNQGQA